MDDYIEKQIAKTEQEVYGGDMPAANKATLRDMLRKEEKFEERRQFLEEEGHSHSAVGDWNGMEVREQ